MSRGHDPRRSRSRSPAIDALEPSHRRRAIWKVGAPTPKNFTFITGMATVELSSAPRELYQGMSKTPHSNDRSLPILPPVERSDKNDRSSPLTPQSTRPARRCAPYLDAPPSTTPAPGSPPIPLSLTPFIALRKDEAGTRRPVTGSPRLEDRLAPRI
jgi:hypothetical protein